jgi:uncharacterized membrane protein YphA (DoxX/SURF4 family)
MERVAVGTVLVLAGAFKLAQPAWTESASRFGAPNWLGRALPWVELLLGALLVAGVGGRLTAVLALFLLVVFTVAVALRLRWQEPVPCGCMGESSPEPIGRDTLVRNILLSALALVSVFRGGSGGPWSVAAGVAIALLIVAQSRARSRVGR